MYTMKKGQIGGFAVGKFGTILLILLALVVVAAGIYAVTKLTVGVIG